MDIKNKAKSKVLQDLIDMMDSKMVDGLKSKSPKFAQVDIQSDDPELANNLKDKLVEGIKEDDMEDPLKEMSSKDIREDISENENPLNENDHNDEDMQRLLEMYKKLK